MTEKRFSYKLDEIFDEGNHFAYALSKENAEDIVELLNELHEENQKKDKVITHLMRIIHSNEPYVFAKAVEKNVKEMLK